jgi:cysteine desulfurase
VPLLVDAAQSLGRVPVPGGWSVLAASARKWGGPAGVGLLAVRAGVRFATDPVWRRRADAVSVPLVVAAAAALQGETLEDLEVNIRDAYQMVVAEERR